jgi:CheY-like chemotaxis protein
MLNSKKTCVLIDDDEDDQLIFETVLNMHFLNYKLKPFSNFEDAKYFILKNPECIDAIFIDLNIPKFNGIDCLSYLRNQPEFKSKSIIIYSTSNNPDDSKRCLKSGATAFLTKPSRVNDLVKELGVFLQS